MKTYKIEITIECSDESGFDLSIDQVAQKLKEGFRMGRDGNDEESYSFAIVSETGEFEEQNEEEN